MKIYKDEDSKIIFEYIKEMRKTVEKESSFLSALERKLVQAHYNEEELNKCKEELKYYKELENALDDKEIER